MKSALKCFDIDMLNLFNSDKNVVKFISSTDIKPITLKKLFESNKDKSLIFGYWTIKDNGNVLILKIRTKLPPLFQQEMRILLCIV